MANRLTLEPWTEADGRIELAATLDLAGRSQRLWWRLPAEWRDALTTWADPFVIGFAFPIMQAGQDVEVVGPVSPSLPRQPRIVHGRLGVVGAVPLPPRAHRDRATRSSRPRPPSRTRS